MQLSGEIQYIFSCRSMNRVIAKVKSLVRAHLTNVYIVHSHRVEVPKIKVVIGVLGIKALKLLNCALLG